MSRAARIQQLIQLRDRIGHAVAKTVESMKDLRSRITDLDRQRGEIAEQLPPDPVRTKLEAVSFAALTSRATDIISTLDQALQRFRRPRLQIGVLGRGGQGKSKLLQQLTGLDDRIIPSGEGLFCTGARSIISHDPDATEPYANIYFYTETEYLHEEIAPYFDYLARDPACLLGPRPVTLDQFQQMDLRRTEVIRSGGDTATKLKYLLEQQEALPRFRSQLGCGKLERVPCDQIRSYVAQFSAERQPLFNFKAVRRAEIFCKFPNVDVVELSFADMPGLGEIRLGQEDHLKDALAADTDLVLMVKYPQGTRAGEWQEIDATLYQVASQALTQHLPIREWMWLILNVDARNSRYVRDLRNTVEKAGIRVAGFAEADCTKADQVYANVLDPLLGFLEQRLETLDRMYLDNVRAELDTYRQEVVSFCEAARKIVPKLPSHAGAEWQLWLTKHEDFRRRLNSGLEDLVQEMRQRRNEPDPQFRDTMEDVLQACLEQTDSTLVPSAESLRELRKQVGNMMAAMGLTMERVRSRLTQRFLALDDSLRQSFGEIKQRVWEAFLGTGIQLADSRVAGDPLATLEQMAREAECKVLAESVRWLANFQLTYFSFIHHRIREHLDPLMPDCGRVPAYQAGEEEDAVNFIWDAVGQAIWNIHKEMGKLSLEPSMSRFATVEEFKDQVLRREEIDQEWKAFTFYFRESLWPDDFHRVAGEQGLYRSWLDALRMVQTQSGEPLSCLNIPPQQES